MISRSKQDAAQEVDETEPTSYHGYRAVAASPQVDSVAMQPPVDEALDATTMIDFQFQPGQPLDPYYLERVQYEQVNNDGFNTMFLGVDSLDSYPMESASTTGPTLASTSLDQFPSAGTAAQPLTMYSDAPRIFPPPPEDYPFQSPSKGSADLLFLSHSSPSQGVEASPQTASSGAATAGAVEEISSPDHPGHPHPDHSQRLRHHHPHRRRSSTTGAPAGPASEKAQRSREKNRAAAAKCRQKVKLSADALQARERDVSAEHRRLSVEASTLRDEVLQLKNAVLSHGDCENPAIQNYISREASKLQ